jgi:hypothetical protein
MTKESTRRPRETRYFSDARYKKTKLAMSRGFPKSEEGSIKGASNAVARGFAEKVQCIDRTHEGHERVLWTVKPGERIPGLRIRPVQVFKGDPDDKPTFKREK